MPDLACVFVSSTTADLGSYRLAVRNKLMQLEVHPVVQDDWPPDYRTIVEMLRDRISKCDAVICVIGRAYGCEPKSRPDDQPRRSYTQLEYDLARELNKPLYVFVAGADCPFDGSLDEPEEIALLQRDHINRVTSGDGIWQQFNSVEELTAKVAVIRFRHVGHRVRRTVGYIVTASVLAFAFWLLHIAFGFGPPWPDPPPLCAIISTITVAAALLTMRVIYQQPGAAWMCNSKLMASLWMAAMVAVPLIGLCGTLFFCHPAGDRRHWTAGGYILRPEIAAILKPGPSPPHDPTATVQGLLEDVGYDTLRIWEPWTVYSVRLASLFFWIASVAVLTWLVVLLGCKGVMPK